MLAMSLYGYLADYALLVLAYLSLIVNVFCFFRWFRCGGRRRLRLVVGNLLVFAGLLATVGMIGETYLRFVSVRTDGFGMSLPARRWFLVHTKLNSLGCRDKEWTRKAALSTRRIAFVGDSFTYGWGVEKVQDRFTDLVQARFDARGKGTVEVLNVAKPGWGTADELRPITDMIDAYAVSEIVLCYVPNDIESVLPKSARFDPTQPPESPWVNPDGSCLLDYLYRRILLPLAPTVYGYHDWLADGFSRADTLAAHQQALQAIASACSKRGVHLRAALFPFLRAGGERFDQTAILTGVQRFLEANGVEVLNLVPIFDGLDTGPLTVNSADAHPNERAHAMAADAIWKAFYQIPPARDFAATPKATGN